MIRERDMVALTADLPEHGLMAGDVGAVQLVIGKSAYEVEFSTFAGRLVAVLTLESPQVRPLGPREMPHARPMPRKRAAKRRA